MKFTAQPYHGAPLRKQDALNPSNPHSASKAGGDGLAYAYWVTYKLPVIITRASNNYGSYQYPEKVFHSLFITNALEDKKLPLYGDGKQVRDWIHVDDHCEAIDFLITHGKNGEVLISEVVMSIVISIQHVLSWMSLRSLER